MSLSLDTSAYSFFRRGHAEIVALLQTVPKASMSAIVIGELLTGFKQGSKRKQNEQGLQAFLTLPWIDVLVVDEATAVRYAEITAYLRTQGTPLPSNDIWIAAHAMQHGLQVVTLDRHFLQMPQVSTVLIER